MIKIISKSLIALLWGSLACGVIYPLMLTVFSQTFFRTQANGSLVIDAQRNVLGSFLLGQKFTSDRFFSGRPSASDYETLPSGASNLSQASTALREKINERAKQYRLAVSGTPADLLTASGSGLDPDISYESAILQIPRIASARKVPQARIAGIVRNLSRPQLPLFSKPRIVNVVMLNQALEGDSSR